MEDISPALLKKCQKSFTTKVNDSVKIKSIIKRVRDGTATLSDASSYTSEIGKILGEVLSKEIKLSEMPEETLFWNIASSVISPMIKQNYDLVNIMADDCRSIAYQSAKIGIKPVRPKFNEERSKGILKSVCEDDITQEQLTFRLSEEPRNITESFYTDYVHENASREYAAGLMTKVVRVVGSSGCCAWCNSLAGVYDYEDVKETGNEVWLRHLNCDCDITWISAKRTDHVENYKRIKAKGK